MRHADTQLINSRVQRLRGRVLSRPRPPAGVLPSLALGESSCSRCRRFRRLRRSQYVFQSSMLTITLSSRVRDRPLVIATVFSRYPPLPSLGFLVSCLMVLDFVSDAITFLFFRVLKLYPTRSLAASIPGSEVSSCLYFLLASSSVRLCTILWHEWWPTHPRALLVYALLFWAAASRRPAPPPFA